MRLGWVDLGEMLLLGVIPSAYGTQRVLIVDDKADVRDLLRAKFGLTKDIEVVGEACDSHRGLTMVAALEPDGVVLDLDMPFLRGEDAIPLIRAVSRRTKIVVYSGSRPSEVAGLASHCAPDAFVLKGARLDALISTLRDLARLNTIQSKCRIEEIISN